MQCCENCFNDIELKAFIKGRQVTGNCDICNSHNINIYDMEADGELAEMFDDFLSIYSPKDKLPEDYPDEYLCFLREELVHRWNIFNLNSQDVLKLMTNLLKVNFPSKLNLFRELVGIPELHDTKKIDENTILKGYSWEKFVEYLKYKNRFHSSHINYKILDEFLKQILTVIPAGKKLYRARISNDKVLESVELGAPPKEFATAGRANSEGIRHLYLATNPETAVREIRPGEGDRIYIGEFECERDLVIVDLKGLEKISVFQSSDKLFYAMNREDILKISSEISKPVRRTDSKLDYLPTQYIVDYIKSKSNEEEFESCSGIGFKSTLCSIGDNVMIFDPEIMECKNVTERVIRSITYNA
jgi:hypothetical protein